MDFIELVDWTALTSTFSAACIAVYGAYKAIMKFVDVLRKKKA